MRRAGIEVITAGLSEQEIVASRGVRLLADTLLDEVQERRFDMIVLPGGLPGADHLNNDPRIHALLKQTAEQGGYTAAICAAPKVLLTAGMLKGGKVTGYPGALADDLLAESEYTGEAVTCEDRIVTSRGPGTAMDFALTLIELLAGKERRDEVESGLVR